MGMVILASVLHLRYSRVLHGMHAHAGCCSLSRCGLAAARSHHGALKQGRSDAAGAEEMK